MFVRVVLFQRRRELLAFRRVVANGSRLPARTRAFCAEVVRFDCRSGVRRRDPVIAVVAFWVREAGVGIVAHEMFHATAAWARRRSVDTKSLGQGGDGLIAREDPEERMAEVHEALVRQFVGRAYKLRLYEG